MNKLIVLFYPKEIKELLGELDSLWSKYDSQEFNTLELTSCVGILKPLINNQISKDKKKIREVIKMGTSPKIIALTMVANLAGDLAESGQFHLYRGVLNPMTGGEALIKVYNDIIEQLVDIGEITKETGKRNKNQIIENIKTVG